MSDLQMLGQAQGINANLAKLIQVMSDAFVGSASTGTFTMAAAASKSVTDTNVKATSYVIPFALNAAAGTLQGSAKALYTTAADGSFTAATASGASAAGTEAFGYLVLNIA
jgi:hypothetical protein